MDNTHKPEHALPPIKGVRNKEKGPMKMRRHNDKPSHTEGQAWKDKRRREMRQNRKAA